MNASTWLDKVIGRPMSAMLPAERAAERIITHEKKLRHDGPDNG